MHDVSDFQSLDALEAEIGREIGEAGDEAALDAVRVRALGRRGRVSLLLRELGGMEAQARKELAPRLNRLKDALQARISERRSALHAQALYNRLATETLDVTLPPRFEARGTIHPVSQVTDELVAIFADMGFEVAEGPDIEDDFHNFTALNIPPEHPARQMHDTIYLSGDDGARTLLRTHTSPVQVRTMLGEPPPIRIIVPGRVYRNDYGATKTPMFHQIEALVIDEETHMGHLKGCIEAFVKAFFEVDDIRLRFRPSYFPFTEPSAEVDIGCAYTADGIRFGEGDDWLEVLGCGMVHPNVLRNCGLDPDRYQGYAFGLGIDRLALLKYGMPDLRAFFEPDIRWLRHYGFSALDMPALYKGLTR